MTQSVPIADNAGRKPTYSGLFTYPERPGAGPPSARAARPLMLCKDFTLGAAIAAALSALTVAQADAAWLPDVEGGTWSPPPLVNLERAPSGPRVPPPGVSSAPNRLTLELGRLDVSVGGYADCTRTSAVGYAGAYVDACIPRPLAYFIGHNPGPFAPLADVATGQVINYVDGQGALHRLLLVSSRVWNRFWGPPPLARGDVVAQFQTCISADAVWDRILDAVELPRAVPTPLVAPLGDYRTQS